MQQCITPPDLIRTLSRTSQNFLSEFIPKFVHLFICGDFNIHVCCSANQLANEFKGLLDSFGLTQSVNAPTHEHGHTLDLVISLGLSISLRDIVDTVISDHLPVVFDASLLHQQPQSLLLLSGTLNCMLIPGWFLLSVQTGYYLPSTQLVLLFCILLPLFG